MEGSGSHVLAAWPDAVHVYRCEVTTLLPPPIAKPSAQVVVMPAPVAPLRLDPDTVLEPSDTVGQLTTAKYVNEWTDSMKWERERETISINHNPNEEKKSKQTCTP